MLKDGEARELLGIAQVMRDMLRTWIDLPWAQSVEVVDMQSLPSDYVSQVPASAGKAVHRYGDVAWLVDVREEGEESRRQVLVLVEAQRRSTRTMALRMLEYVSLAMSRMLDRNGRVEPILPVVLYTGPRPWTAPRSTTSLIRNKDLVPSEVLPQLSYLVLELGRLPLPEEASRRNLATELVRAMTSDNSAELTASLRALMLMAEVRGERDAADTIARRLAPVLARRYAQAQEELAVLKVNDMEDLIRKSIEWNYTPGPDDIQDMIDEERELRQAAEERAERLVSEIRAEQRKREQEQRKREREQRKREQEQRKREQEQLRQKLVLQKVLRQLDPQRSDEALQALSLDALQARVDEMLDD